MDEELRDLGETGTRKTPLSAEALRSTSERTIHHYNQHAESFWLGTRDHDVSQNTAALLRHLPSQGPLAILDFGCGPGRDLITFRDMGHEAVGLDGSGTFAEMARRNSGCEVWQQDFLALDLPTERFDGVFANASLFHCPSQVLPKVLQVLHGALKTGGILFSSNPRGPNREGWSGERYGCYLDVETYRLYMADAGFEELEHFYRPRGSLAINSRGSRRFGNEGAMWSEVGHEEAWYHRIVRSLCLVVLALAVVGSSPVAATPGATLVRADHVRVWVADPLLMPERPDGTSWSVRGESPRLQLTIRLSKGTARSGVQQSSKPKFSLAPFNVAVGERVRVGLWELQEFGQTLLGEIDFVAGAKQDSVAVSSSSLMLFSARAQPIDVWSIPELSLVVPFRINEAALQTINKGLGRFHKRLHQASRGQIRIERYRFYETPTKSETQRLAEHGVLVAERAAGVNSKGTPAAPAPMVLAVAAMTSSGEFSKQLFSVFENAVLGARSPLLPPESAATVEAAVEAVQPVPEEPLASVTAVEPGESVELDKPVEPEKPLEIDPARPWQYVRANLEKDLGLVLMPLDSSRKSVPAARPDVDIVRAHTLDLSESSSVASTIDGKEIQRIVGLHSARLGQCLVTVKEQRADILLTIGGQGQVSRLSVNGKSEGVLQTCVLGVAKTIGFPKTKQQTHARFVMSL